MINIPELDETDNKILNIIEHNARLSYSEIGEQVGLSRVSVKTRMDNLVNKGVIKGFKTVIDEEAVNSGDYRYVIIVEIYHDMLSEAMDILAANKTVKAVHQITGGDRFLIEGVASYKPSVTALLNQMYSKNMVFKRITVDTIMRTLMDTNQGIQYHKEEQESKM